MEPPRLSAAQVARWTGNAVMQQGRALVDAITDARQSAGVLQADVRDEAMESVTVELDLAGVRSAWCSCRLGEHGMCTHVAAVLLAWGEGRGFIEEAGDPMRPGMPAEELEAWARANGVEGWLREPVDVVSGRIRGKDSAWFWRFDPGHDLGSAICASDVPASIQEACIGRVRSRLQQARAALAFEAEAQAWRAVAPSDPKLRQVWERLHNLRQILRSRRAPTAISPAEDVHLALEPDPPTISWGSPGRAPCTGHYNSRGRLRLQGAGAFEVRCRCTPDGPARCDIALSTVDAALDVLTRVDGEVMAREIAVLLETPSWERQLAALDRVLAGPGADPEGRRLGWLLTTGEDELRIEPVLVRPFKNREGFRHWRIGLERAGDLGVLDGVDREVLALLEARPDRHSGRYTAVAPDLTHRAIEQLVGHDRVFVDGGDPVPVPVVRRSLSLALSMDGELEIGVELSGHPVSAEALLDGAWFANGRLVRVDGVVEIATVDPLVVSILGVLAERGAAFPEPAAQAVLDRLVPLEERVGITLDGALRGQQIVAEQRPLVRLEGLAQDGLRVQIRARPLAKGPVFVPGIGPVQIYGRDGQQRVFVERELLEEAKLMRQAVADWPLGEESAPFTWVIREPRRALRVLAALRQDDALMVEWTGRARAVHPPADSGALRIRVDNRKDWLGIEGELVLDGLSVSLEAVLLAALAGERFVRVDEEAWIELAEPLRQKLQAAARAAWSEGDTIRLSPLHEPLLVGLQQAGAELVTPPDFGGLQAVIRESHAWSPEAPSTLQATLRPYQLHGFQWLARLARWSPGACLADDMGLGKTLQSLALLLHRAASGPALVVAPTSVGFNWMSETARFAPGLSVALYRGSDRERLLDALGPADVVVTSYELLARDIDALASRPWGTVIFDEAQAIKNPRTQRARAAAALESGFCLALSGTPIENHLGELWALFSVLVPGLLGPWPRFRERFVLPIAVEDGSERATQLSSFISPFLLRRLKKDVLTDLPPRTDVLVRVELSRGEQELYDAVRIAAVQGLGPHGERIQVLAALTRLRQLACHPRLLDPDSEVPSSKLARLREMVQELREGGHRALIFSQFTGHLALVREALLEDGVQIAYLDGQTPAARRQAEVEAFQAGEGEVFLISLKAGGTGLNLTAADYVIHLDPWWNPAAEDQATDRAHRIGQRRAVTVYRLVAQGTIEEAMLRLHDEKRALVEELLSGEGRGPSVDELLELLRGVSSAEV